MSDTSKSAAGAETSPDAKTETAVAAKPTAAVAEPAAPATPATPANTASPGNSEVADNSGLFTPGMALLALMLGGYAFYRTLFPLAANQLTVVDSDRLAAAYIQAALAGARPGDDPALIQRQLLAQINGIQTKLDSMSANGQVVVRKSAVLTYPPAADATERIAAELGIHLLPETAPALPMALPAAAGLPGSAAVPGTNGHGTSAQDGRLGAALD